MQEAAVAAQEHVKPAIDFLAKVYGDDKEHMRYRIQAAQMLLDRGAGQCVALNIHRQILESHNGNGGQPGVLGAQNGQNGVSGSFSTKALDGISDQELIEFLKPRLDQDEAQEAEFEEVTEQ